MKRSHVLRLLSLILIALILGGAALAGPNGFAGRWADQTALADSPLDLQAAIDAARPGAVIEVPPGLYRGNLLIEKPLTLAGIDWPIIDGGSRGNVIEINNAPGVTIRGLIIRNSGARLDKENAGIAANQSPRLVVENNRLENVLFGISIDDSAKSRLAYNVIGAKDLEAAARGDGIRVWYSEKAEVIGNQVNQGRDVVFWYNNGAVA
jgi:nitrous oxidase accessory protein